MFAQVMPAPVPAGGRLVSVDGRTLPLCGTRIDADACAGLCRVTLVQRFANVYADPLHVTYQVPLPADGAVSGYAFELAGERTVGVVKSLPDARDTFQRAVMSGRTAALLEQDRSSLFTQSLGNIPPGQEVVVTLTIDQPLMWEDGGWTWRFPTTVAPRYQNQSTPDPQRQSVDIAERDTGVRTALRLNIRDVQTGSASSPSHGMGGRDVIELNGAPLDRDVVVSWPVAAPTPGVSVDTGVLGAQPYALLTVVPPATPMLPVPRDLIVLIDTSGSMGGEPLRQAVAVVDALIDTLSPFDQLELIEFSDRPRRWKKGATACTPRELASARRWLSGLHARGGTEMHSGIMAALAGLRAEAQRQVVLITDGLIGFEHQIVGAVAHALPSGSRVHTVGIGSSVNRSLTGPTARAGRGVEVIVPPYTDVSAAVRTLVARTDSLQVVDLQIDGPGVRATAPSRLPDLYRGAPARIAIEVPHHGGQVTLRGRTANGEFTHTVHIPPSTGGNRAVPTLYGREQVEDLEVVRASGGPASLDQAIESLGVHFQIVTRMTAFVAVSEQVTVDPRAPTRAEAVPHALAQAVSAEGVGLRPAAPTPQMQGVPVPTGALRATAVLAEGAIGGFGGGGADLDDDQELLDEAPTDGLGSAGPLGRSDRAEAKAQVTSRTRAGGVPPPAPQPAAAPPPPARRPAPAKPSARPAQGAGAPTVEPEPTVRRPGRGARKAKKKGGLLGRLRRTLRKLMGTLVLRDGDKWVIEVRATAAVAWEAHPTADVTLDDGRTITCSVDASSTTATGSIAAGQVIRLTLVHAETAAPKTIEIAGLVIEL